nr:cytochrome P450 CYP736A12-like [Ipomoea batatas]
MALLWTTLVVLVAVSLIHGLVKKMKGKKLPPGPRGLPILGHLHLLGKNPHHDLTKLAKHYGPIMHLRFGFADIIVASSPQAAQLFLKTHDLVFASRPPHEAAKYLSYGQKNLGYSQYGPYWRNMRKLATLQMVFGKKYEIKDIDERGFKAVIKEAMQIAAEPNVGDYFPFLAKFDFQGLTRRMKVITKVFDRFFERILDDHEQSGGSSEMTKDLVDIMLSILKSGETEFQFTREHIKSTLLDIFAASIDTSTTMIEWIMSELLRHPQIMKKVQQELERKIGLGRMVEESDLEGLDYLEMVIKESFRLHPAGPLLLPHEAREDCMVDGFHIPKQAQVIVNIWAMGHDPNVWVDPEKFIPERFERSNIDYRGCNFELIPFGSGRRSCPGLQLGITMVRLVVAQLVHCFDWKLPNGILPIELDMTEEFGLVVTRAEHLRAVPKYRLHI